MPAVGAGWAGKGRRRMALSVRAWQHRLDWQHSIGSTGTGRYDAAVSRRRGVVVVCGSVVV